MRQIQVFLRLLAKKTPSMIHAKRAKLYGAETALIWNNLKINDWVVLQIGRASCRERV